MEVLFMGVPSRYVHAFFDKVRAVCPPNAKEEGGSEPPSLH
jgi:hypothetical protein